MKINNAYVCSDCETLTESSRGCPACASSELYPLAAWLNRHPEAKENFTVDTIGTNRVM